MLTAGHIYCLPTLSASVLIDIFTGGPGYAGTRMSPFWFLLEVRVTELMVTTGAIRSAKLQSNCHHQQTNTQLFTGWMPFLLSNQQCQSTEGKIVGNSNQTWFRCCKDVHSYFWSKRKHYKSITAWSSIIVSLTDAVESIRLPFWNITCTQCTYVVHFVTRNPLGEPTRREFVPLCGSLLTSLPIQESQWTKKG